jgi:hypothetical protein
LNRIARGHPLALTLASAGVAEHPELGLQDAAITRVVGELARIYLQEINDVLTRRALEAASVVRRATGPLLSAMLEDTDGDDALSRLLELPFVDTGRYGLVVHEAVKDAVADFVRGRTRCDTPPTGAQRGVSCAPRHKRLRPANCGVTPPTCFI